MYRTLQSTNSRADQNRFSFNAEVETKQRADQLKTHPFPAKNFLDATKKVDQWSKIDTLTQSTRYLD